METCYLPVLLRTWNDINTRYKKKKRKNEKKTRTKRNEVLDGVRSDFLSINSSWFFRAVNLSRSKPCSSHEKVAREASTHIVAAVER